MRTLAFIISITLLSGQIPQTTPEQQTADIAGTILRADNAAPLGGVRVLLRKDQSVRSENDYGTMTDSDGHFVLKNIEPGRYRLLAKQSGFIDAQYGQKRPSRPGSVLELAKGEKQLDLQVRMTAGSVVSGRVYDDLGRPLSSVEVQLIQPRYQSDGHITPVAAANTTTDDRGEYRLYWIAPGNYYAVATVFQRGPSSDVALSEQFEGSEQVMLPTFYPNSLDDTHATPIKVEPGTELPGIDFTMARMHAVRVRGEVIDGSTGTVVPGARVSLKMKTDGWANLSGTASVISDINGAFEVRRVAPGTNTITASITLPGPRQAANHFDVQIGEKDISDLQVVLQPIPSLTGRVLFEGERSEGSLRFLDIGSGAGVAAGVNKDGSFVVPTIAAAVYRVVLNFPDTFFIRSASSGSRDVLRDGVDVTTGTPDPIEIRVAWSAGTVQGAVTDENDKPFVGAQVALIPSIDRHERTDLFKNAPTDQFGRFAIRGVAPGNYKLFAWEDIEPGAYFDPEFLQQYETLGSPIHVDEGGSVTMNLKAIP